MNDSRFSLMICLDKRSGPILVAGGGNTALRKIRTLLDAGFSVDLVAMDILPDIKGMEGREGLRIYQRRIQKRDFHAHSFAVIAMSRDDTESLLPLAEGTGCHLNCSGAPELGTWSLAAQFTSGEFLIGTSSHGRSPAGSAALKAKIMKTLHGEEQL